MFLFIDEDAADLLGQRVLAERLALPDTLAVVPNRLVLVVENDRHGQAWSRQPEAQAEPMDEFTVVINDVERAALIDVLEQSLAQTQCGGAQPSRANETIRGVLDRLRGSGV